MLPPQYTSPFKKKVELPHSKGRPIHPRSGRKARFIFILCLGFFVYGLWHVEGIEPIDQVKNEAQDMYQKSLESMAEKLPDLPQIIHLTKSETTSTKEEAKFTEVDKQPKQEKTEPKGQTSPEQNLITDLQATAKQGIKTFQQRVGTLISDIRTKIEAATEPAQNTFAQPQKQSKEQESNNSTPAPKQSATQTLSSQRASNLFKAGGQIETLKEPTPFYLSPKHQTEKGAVHKGAILKIEAVRPGWVGIKGGERWFWIKQSDVQVKNQ